MQRKKLHILNVTPDSCKEFQKERWMYTAGV
jgi:hypothetical protein